MVFLIVNKNKNSNFYTHVNLYLYNFAANHFQMQIVS